MKKLLLALLLMNSSLCMAEVYRDHKMLTLFVNGGIDPEGRHVDPHPCPLNGKLTTSCKVTVNGKEVRYVLDHGIPRCAGGADRPYNLGWQKYDKGNSLAKDTDERTLCRRLHPYNKASKVK